MCAPDACRELGSGRMGCVQARPGPSQAASSRQHRVEGLHHRKLNLPEGGTPCLHSCLVLRRHWGGDHPRQELMSSPATQGTVALCKPVPALATLSQGRGDLADDHPSYPGHDHAGCAARPRAVIKTRRGLSR